MVRYGLSTISALSLWTTRECTSTPFGDAILGPYRPFFDRRLNEPRLAWYGEE
jgi:hypothetical protein